MLGWYFPLQCIMISFFIDINNELLYQLMPIEGNFDNICILIYYKFDEFYLLY